MAADEGGEVRKAFDGTTAPGYDYLDHEGAKFRRRRGKVSGTVDDILNGDKWEPYQGNRLYVGTWSDRINDPFGG